MTTKYKIIAGLILLVGCFLGGFYTGRGQKEIQIVEKKVEVKGEDKVEIIYRDRIVEHTITKFANGTTIIADKVTNENTTKNEEKKIEAKSDISKSTTTSTASNYSLGLREHMNYSALLPTSTSLKNGAEVTAGRRLFGDIWLDIGVMPVNHDISIGIRVDF